MNDTALAVQQAPTSTAIEQVRNTQVALAPETILNRAELIFFADMITSADLIPYDKHTTKEVQKFRVMSKIIAGAAHGFDPISSQENLHIISGRLVLSARGMGVKLRRTGKYDTRVEESTDKKCRLKVLERGDDGKWFVKGHVEFTKDHAEKAGLLTSNAAMYNKFGEDMLYANAIKRVCRRFAPEVLDTEPVATRLAKENQVAAAPAAAPAQLPAAAPAPEVAAPRVEPQGPGDTQGMPDAPVEHVDPPFVETVADEIAGEAVEGDFIEAGDAEAVDAEVDEGLDHEVENLRAATQDLFESLTKMQQKDVIGNGPKISAMDADQLADTYTKLQAYEQ